MDIFQQIFIKTGVPWDTFVVVAGMVYALVELVKGKFKTLDGNQVQIVNAAACVGIALLFLWGNWFGVVAVAVFSFFGADAVHNLRFGKEIRAGRQIAQSTGNNDHSQLSKLGDQN